MTTRKASTTLSPDRVCARADRLTKAIAERIRDAMGGMTQSELAKRIKKSPSTVSTHLNGRTNLTLKTIVEYAVVLDAEVVSVVDLQSPPKRRRRRKGKRTVSKERKAMTNMDPVKRKLHDLLTDLTARIGQIIQADAELSQRELARRMDRDEAYVSRALAGGVNLTLKTIAAFEEALGEAVLRVEGQDKRIPSSTYETSSQFVQIARSSDGGFCLDQAGVVSGAMDHYVGRENQAESVEEFSVAA
jgi:transcriptional regulator with XRE-family HTH domain